MRVDFYVLGEVPAERIVTALAAKALEGGDRLLVVEGDAGKRAALSRALWAEAFLANGLAEEHPTPAPEREPRVRLSDC